MGFFDDIYCDMPLPDGHVPKRGLQTKSLDDPQMRKYRITVAGRLVRQFTAPDEDFDCGYHGIINFYDYDKPPGDPKFGYDASYWHEYNAKFTDGKCVGITLVTPEVTADVST